MKHKIAQSVARFTYVVIMVAFFITILVFNRIENTTNVRYRIENKIQLSNEWVVDNTNETITFPYNLTIHHENPTILSTTLPKNIKDNQSIYFDTKYMAVEVYVDGELIYDYGVEKALGFGLMNGSSFAIIPLETRYEGTQLTIKFINPYNKTSFEFPGVFIGTAGEFKFNQLYSNMWRLIVFASTMTVAVFTMIIGIHHWLVINSDKNLAYIYYALLVVGVGSWMVLDYSISQFFTNSLVIIQYTSISCLIFIGSYFMGLCGSIFYKQKVVFHSCELLGYVLFLVMLVLYVANICDPINFLPAIHVFAVVVLITAIAMSYIYRKDYYYAIHVCRGTILLLVGVGISLLIFIKNPLGNGFAFTFLIGFALYSTMLFSVVLSGEQTMLVEATKAETYHHMAYNDFMTNLYNRAAFEIALDRLDSLKEETNVVMLVCDLNRLKQTNDSLGHDAGDKLICAAANALKKAFDIYEGECFRLGGDEFAVILINPNQDIEQILAWLEQNIIQVSRSEGIEVSMAVGFASCTVPFNGTTSRYALYRVADQDMYMNKSQMHESSKV